MLKISKNLLRMKWRGKFKICVIKRSILAGKEIKII